MDGDGLDHGSRIRAAAAMWIVAFFRHSDVLGSVLEPRIPHCRHMEDTAVLLGYSVHHEDRHILLGNHSVHLLFEGGIYYFVVVVVLAVVLPLPRASCVESGLLHSIYPHGIGYPLHEIDGILYCLFPRENRTTMTVEEDCV